MSEYGDLVGLGHWWTGDVITAVDRRLSSWGTPVRFLDSPENDVITTFDRRLSSWGNISKSPLETGHGNDGYIDSGEQVLESL